MHSLFLAPHNDDETLFGAFTILRHRPDVVVCYRSAKQEAQGVTEQERHYETTFALQALIATRTDPYPSYPWNWWDDFDTVEDGRENLRVRMAAIADRYDRVFAPAIEDGGHGQHNHVGEVALAVFGDRVTPYLTYTDGRDRSRSENEVPYEPEWIAAKLRALACYPSQHRLWSTAHHFLADQREYYV